VKANEPQLDCRRRHRAVASATVAKTSLTLEAPPTSREAVQSRKGLNYRLV
jgi:hypothetical protein